MKKQNYDFEIKCLNPTDYELKITYKAENALLLHIFQQAKRKIENKTNTEVNGDISTIKEIKIPRKWYNYIDVANRRITKDLVKIFKKDDIVLLNFLLSDVKFIKINQDWSITLTYSGLYVDKR